jgi:hypothetical protein
MEARKRSVKIKNCNELTRRVSVSEEQLKLGSMLKLAVKLFKSREVIGFSYFDSEGDKVIVTSEPEFEECLSTFSDRLLVLQILSQGDLNYQNSNQGRNILLCFLGAWLSFDMIFLAGPFQVGVGAGIVCTIMLILFGTLFKNQRDCDQSNPTHQKERKQRSKENKNDNHEATPVEAAKIEVTPPNQFIENFQKLEEMGFKDKKKNIEMLVKHKNSLHPCIHELIACK